MRGVRQYSAFPEGPKGLRWRIPLGEFRLMFHNQSLFFLTTDKHEYTQIFRSPLNHYDLICVYLCSSVVSLNSI